MGWLIVLAIPVVVYFIVSAMFSQKDSGKATNPNLLSDVNRYSAKRGTKIPGHLEIFLKEEFPEFSNDISFSKVVQLNNVYGEVWRDRDQYVKDRNATGFFLKPNEFKNEDLERSYKKRIASETGACISEEFMQFAVSDPDRYFKALDRAYTATHAKIDAEMGTISEVVPGL